MCAKISKTKIVNKVVLLDVGLIYPNPSQPRVVFDKDELISLSESIAKNGLLQPLTVRCKGRYYELISGERRLRALKLAKIKEASCIVVDTSERQAAVFALLENIQRADLNYFEEASALKKLINEWGISQQELGAKLGMAQSTIANKLRLLKFNDINQKKILNNNLNERQARALLKLTDQQQLDSVIENIFSKKMNVSQTERYIESFINKKNKHVKSFHPIVKDVRLFLNTINHAISVMNQSGIKASSRRIEKDNYIEYIVKIPIENQVSGLSALK